MNQEEEVYREYYNRLGSEENGPQSIFARPLEKIKSAGLSAISKISGKGGREDILPDIADLSLILLKLYKGTPLTILEITKIGKYASKYGGKLQTKDKTTILEDKIAELTGRLDSLEQLIKQNRNSRTRNKRNRVRLNLN